MLQPGPGLTVVLGRNGSGKSSFADALELLVTGTCSRWNHQAAAWREGWRNLHHAGASRIEAKFVIDGAAPVNISRAWEAGAGLEASELIVRRGQERLSGLGALGWQDALRTYRPFLSYAELGLLAAEPSALYDQLQSILGLHEVTAARKLLAEERKRLGSSAKAVKDEVTELRRVLDGTEDPRARECAQALAGRRWDLATLERLVARPSEAEDPHLALFRRLSRLELPDLDQVGAAVSRLRRALEQERAVADTHAQNADRLAQLLQGALDYGAGAGGPCPLCGGPLAADWREHAQRRIEQAREQARALRAARDEVAVSYQQLRALVRPVPADLKHLADAGFSDAAFYAWRVWAAMPSTPSKRLATWSGTRLRSSRPARISDGRPPIACRRWMTSGARWRSG